MLALRSFLFNAVFYLNLVVWMIGCLPFFLLPRRAFMVAPRAWARSSLWLLKVIAGTRSELRGADRIPTGGLLVAAKHQSFWDICGLFAVFEDPVFILKRELMWIPLFGWYCWKARMVPVDRKKGSAALGDMLARARAEAQHGRQILIFPEGTRRPPGAEPAYKSGVAHLYLALGVPCLPVALNSGLFWPRRRFVRRPGTIVAEFLDPLPPGLARPAFTAELQRRIEDASERLLAEGVAQLGPADALASDAEGAIRPPRSRTEASPS